MSSSCCKKHRAEFGQTFDEANRVPLEAGDVKKRPSAYRLWRPCWPAAGTPKRQQMLSKEPVAANDRIAAQILLHFLVHPFRLVMRSDLMIAIASNQPESAARELESMAPPVVRGTAENRVIAALLNEIAALLAHQGASEFRVEAYEHASEMLGRMMQPIRDVLEQQGLAGLTALPTIGPSIANRIEQYLRLGRIPLLDRLRGEDNAERLFATLPGLGPELSHRIHEDLEIETLPELFAAINDGRLEKVPGIGRKRICTLRECLAQRIRHGKSQQPARTADVEAKHAVSVSELLSVDAEYRRLAAKDKLPKIAPRKFNPGAVAWLPILHTHRGNRHYTALYSNTARAHQLNTTKDWVIIYRDDHQADGQWTVITSHFGKLHGCRIVRGREDECTKYYLSNRPALSPGEA